MFSTFAAYSCHFNVRTFVFPPFAYKDQHGHWSGIDVEYTKMLLDQARCRYTFIEAPWGRGLEMMRTGQVDMMLNVTRLKEREKYLHFVGPQRLEILRFVSKKDGIDDISQWDQLAQVEGTLMRQRGTFIGERFEQLLRDYQTVKSQLMFLPNTVARIDLIRKGRTVGFFAEQTYLLHAFATNSDYSILKLHPLVINQTPVYFAFSKESVTITQLAKLQKAYSELYKLKKIQAVEGHYDMY